jgi:hypothetical protein
VVPDQVEVLVLERLDRVGNTGQADLVGEAAGR